MKKEKSLITGPIVPTLFKFMVPIFAALFLQSFYGAVDLYVVGKYALDIDISAVSTGSQFMGTIIFMFAGLSMGTTIIVGQKIGEGDTKEAAKTIGASMVMFAIFGVVLSIILPFFAGTFATWINAPKESFERTISYISICGAGAITIIAYNFIGAIFRGVGDSVTPFITVLIASIANIFGDIILVRNYSMGATGAAIATVGAQLISVLLSLIIIKKRGLPFEFTSKYICFDTDRMKKVLRLGAPLALQEFLINFSFLAVFSFVNKLGLTASAGAGITQKCISFILLIPSAFGQAMSAFVAQNTGAGLFDRIFEALRKSICVALVINTIMFLLTFFKGDVMASIFSKDPEVIAAAANYLKAYSFDCILTSFLFNFIGFFNGTGNTRFVMIEGLATAFLVKIPVSYLFSILPGATLFRIGIGVPASSLVQIILCYFYYRIVRKKIEANQVTIS